MNKSLTVIIPVSKYEKIETIRNSIKHFLNLDYTGFDWNVVYCIDKQDNNYDLQTLDNIEICWVKNNNIRQSGNYNAGLDKFPDSDYYAFFDLDGFPEKYFFQKCKKVDADFVTGNSYIRNSNINSITKTISETYEIGNYWKKLSFNMSKMYYPAACCGLIKGKVFKNFRFSNPTLPDNELYMHIINNKYSMGYLENTYYTDLSVTTIKEVYKQNIRWKIETLKNRKIKIFDWIGVVFPISQLLLFPVSIKFIKHIKGYNLFFHLIFMIFVSKIAIIKFILGSGFKWTSSEKIEHCQ